MTAALAGVCLAVACTGGRGSDGARRGPSDSARGAASDSARGAASDSARGAPPEQHDTAGAPADQHPSNADSTDSTRASPPAPLVVRVLDVGQGDATLVTNGTSRVLIDGGPDAERFGHLLDSLGLNGTTIDVVVLSHVHADHHTGLRELFRTRRDIRVRYFFENRDPYTSRGLATLRDSVNARATRGEMIVRDTDDPCADGRPLCTITMNGGARLEILRPDPKGQDPNDRSTPVKLVAADSAEFTMWLTGDAEHDEIAWFDQQDYDVRPGMRVTVLKADHHGSCNGITPRYLALTHPAWVVASLGSKNDYGHMHAQTKALLRARDIPWYRTDVNGTITIRAPGMGGESYTITPQRGHRSADGRSDRVGRACE